MLRADEVVTQQWLLSDQDNCDGVFAPSAADGGKR
jgi:hypothetical protein